MLHALRQIKTDFANFSQLEGNVILVEFIKDMEIDLEQTKKGDAIIMDLADNKPHALIYCAGNYTVLPNKEAKAFIASKDYPSRKVRDFVIGNMANRILVSHFLRFFKPSIETKIFKSLEEAISWCRSFL